MAGLGRHPRPRLPAVPQGGGSRHLGITGNSGGGTMTTWLCGVEQRWTMAAPSCFVTEFRRNMENELARRHRAVPAEGAGPGPGPRRLPGRAGAEADHHPGEGEGLLRRPRQRSGLPPAEAPLSSARRGRQRRALRRPDRARLLPGEPRGDVPLVQPLHGNLGRQDRAEAGDRKGRDAVVHAARPGGRTEIQADLQLHAGEVAGAGGEASAIWTARRCRRPLPRRFGCRSGPACRNSASCGRCPTGSIR